MKGYLKLGVLLGRTKILEEDTYHRRAKLKIMNWT